jgi:hypothetical protein
MRDGNYCLINAISGSSQRHLANSIAYPESLGPCRVEKSGQGCDYQL